MPRGYVGKEWIRCNAYYEFKDVPVKGRVYRYWYFRFQHGGRMRSVYCGKQRPELSPLEAVAAVREGEDLAARFRESRSPLPKTGPAAAARSLKPRGARGPRRRAARGLR